MTNQHYKRLEDGAMDEIDAAVKEAWDNFQVLAGLTGVNLDRKYQ